MSLVEELKALEKKAEERKNLGGDFWKPSKGTTKITFLNEGVKRMVGKFDKTTNQRNEALGTEEVIDYKIKVDGEKEPKTWELKVSENAKATYRKLIKEGVRMKWNDLNGKTVEIDRDGDGTDTTYVFRGEESSSSSVEKKETKKTSADKAITEKVLRAITKFSELDADGVNLNSLVVFFDAQDIKKETIVSTIETLKNEGVVFEPKKGVYKNIEV